MCGRGTGRDLLRSAGRSPVTAFGCKLAARGKLGDARKFEESWHYPRESRPSMGLPAVSMLKALRGSAERLGGNASNAKGLLPLLQVQRLPADRPKAGDVRRVGSFCEHLACTTVGVGDHPYSPPRTAYCVPVKVCSRRLLHTIAGCSNVVNEESATFGRSTPPTPEASNGLTRAGVFCGEHGSGANGTGSRGIFRDRSHMGDDGSRTTGQED